MPPSHLLEYPRAVNSSRSHSRSPRRLSHAAPCTWDPPLSRPSLLYLAASLARMCVHTVTYTRHLALLALRRPRKYCRHPFRATKSDVRKPMDRLLTFFSSIENVLHFLYFRLSTFLRQFDISSYLIKIILYFCNFLTLSFFKYSQK